MTQPPGNPSSHLTPLENFQLHTQSAAKGGSKDGTSPSKSGKKQQVHPSQQHQTQTSTNTTNLTLNMNFNLQQSTIQMQQMGNDPVLLSTELPSHQRIFHSPRPSQPQNGHNTGTLPNVHMSPQPQQQSHFGSAQKSKQSTIAGRDVTPQGYNHPASGITSGKKPSKQLAATGQEAVENSNVQRLHHVNGSPPIHPNTGKSVKKVKMNKLNSDQLNQIRMHQQQNKTNSTSTSLQNSLHNQQNHQMALDHHRTNSVGRQMSGATGIQNVKKIKAGPDGQYIYQGPNGQYAMVQPGQNQGTFFSQQQLTGDQQLQHLQNIQQQHNRQTYPTKSQSVSNMSHRNNNNGTTNTGAAASQGQTPNSRQADSDSKLGHKLERPTVAQLLEIGVSSTTQNWIDEGSQQIAPSGHQRQNTKASSQQVYNSTQSHFLSIGSSGNPLASGGGAPHTTKPSKNLKAQSNMFFEDVRPNLKASQTNSLHSQTNQNSKQLNLPQFKNIKQVNNSSTNKQPRHSRNHNHEELSQAAINSLYNHQQEILAGQGHTSGRRKLESPQDQASASLQHNRPMRNMAGKMMHHSLNESSQGRQQPHLPSSGNTQQYAQLLQQQQQQQVRYMPMLVDMHNGPNGQSQATSNGNARASSTTNPQTQPGQSNQLFSRLQQQFLEQSAVIRHPQMGELPVISMTQQQLNNMIQQAAQHRHQALNFQQTGTVAGGGQHQNAQFSGQSQNLKQTGASGSGSPGSNGYLMMSQMAASGSNGGMSAQGQPQMAFAIQIADQVHPQMAHKTRNGGQQQNSHTQMSSPLHSPEGQASYASQAHQYSQQNQNNGLYLPSLRTQNGQLTPMQQHAAQNQQQASTMPTLQSPMGSNYNGGQMLSQAPIKKMTLQSRGKSVPRSSIRTDDENGHNLMDMMNQSHTSQMNPNSYINQNQALTQQQQLLRQQYQQMHAVAQGSNQAEGTQYRQGHGGVETNNGQEPMITVGNLTTSYLGDPSNARGQANLTQPVSRGHNEHGEALASDGDETNSQGMLVPLNNRKDPRNSMSIRAGGDSTMFVGSNGGNASVQSRRPPNGKQSYTNQSRASDGNMLNAVEGVKSQRGTSRNLATQSDRSSQRAATQGGNIIVGGYPATMNQAAYLQQKGPLSDLIMTQQSNLNVAPRVTGSALRKAKRNKSSITVDTSRMNDNIDPPDGSSHDVNGGIPYLFENSKINNAIAQEDYKSGKQVTLDNNQHHLLQQQQQLHDFIDERKILQNAQEIAKKKKTKGRKNLNSSQRDNPKILQQSQSSKGSGEAHRFGQRQFSQHLQQPAQILPGMIPGTTIIASTQQQHNQIGQQQMSEKTTNKKRKGAAASMQPSQTASNHSVLIQAAQQHHQQNDGQMFDASQYHQHLQTQLAQAQQIISQHQADALMAAQQNLQNQINSAHDNSNGPQQPQVPSNLKPNMSLKRQPTKKISECGVTKSVAADAVVPGQEPSLGQHGMFVKNLVPACTKYYKSKNNSRMTPHKYRNGISTRLLVAKETFQAKRAKLPILVINIDGVLGYFDETKNYQCKEKSITMLQSLSHNFKIVGFSSESKGLITRLGKTLSEFKTPFAFDAVYQIQRKPTQNQNRVNLTHVILDFSSDDEEDLDMFVSSHIALITVDRHNLNEKFETMDLREVFDFDKEYLKGAKAPLIFRVPHARCRGPSSLCFETLYQTITCLLVSSKLGNMETTSFFTYNERTKGMSIPTSDKGILATMIPEKMKLIEKSIQSSKTLRFVMAEPQYGLNFHKGFKMLTEVFKGALKPDYLDFNYRIFKPLLPIRMRLQKITQQALQGAEPPTGKKLMVRCDNEEATRKYQVFAKKNEIVRKHIRKYRARYWAVNQIEDTNLEEENQDIVGDLLDNGIIATTLSDIQSLPTVASAAVDSQDPTNQADKDGVDGSVTGAAAATIPKAATENADGDKLPGGGACSSSSEHVESDSDNEHYDGQAQAVKFKVIDIKQAENDGPVVKRQQTVKTFDPHKYIKIECRKIPKPRHQFLLDFCSKKQNAMLFTTNQQQHLVGAQALQIEANITELVQKLNEQEKTGKKEVFNYDF